jgi:hypothetical protein
MNAQYPELNDNAAMYFVTAATSHHGFVTLPLPLSLARSTQAIQLFPAFACHHILDLMPRSSLMGLCIENLEQ